MTTSANPIIIQGGMGAAVSAWTLARAVSQAGQLGVVSGTALDVVLARRLQMGDPEGHLRQAMAEFPFPEMADRILDQYFIEGGKRASDPYRPIPMHKLQPSQKHLELMVVSNFVEVYLAKQGHDGQVGINYLEKIQLPNLPSIFGAMLAGVDYVLMGAGIPRHIPGVLDRFSEGQAAELPIQVVGAGSDESYVTRFDPVEFTGGELPWLERPKFLAIVSSSTLATMLARKSTGKVDGFIVEGPTAGGHNAPPRGGIKISDRGEPIYGRRDAADLASIGKLGLPFWVAGSYGTPEGVVEALEAGAAGVQVGTAFAFCDESGLPLDLKKTIVAAARNETLGVFTDPKASPTGFPFKVLQMDGTLSELKIYEERHRVCDLGYLRHAYKQEDGKIGYRCPAEETDAFLRKGGDPLELVDRKCICNGLMANVGLPQVRKNGDVEKPIITCGDDVVNVHKFLPSESAVSYSALDVISRLTSLVETPAKVAVAEQGI